jgi:F0F1-type ATP synthase epsilon subunit
MNDQVPQQASLHVVILSPESTIFQGTAVAISSINATGPFDILPLHANFICIIKDSLTIYETQKKIRKIPLEIGILKAFENEVMVFLGIETVA